MTHTPLSDDRFARRFWAKAIQRDDPNEDWGWRGRINQGHAIYSGRVAPRVAWELTNGVVPEGKVVLQRCKNRLCVNPGHLFLGTTSEAVLSGAQGYRKLTAAAVAQIRSQYAAGLATQRELAEKYQVERQTIGKIVTGKNWARS